VTLSVSIFLKLREVIAHLTCQCLEFSTGTSLTLTSCTTLQQEMYFVAHK
jgi:hypothetical protein